MNNNLSDIQIATNDTVLKMIDTLNRMNKRMYRAVLICIISITLILTTLFLGVIYFLNSFEVEATTVEETITHTIEGDGSINTIEGNGTINNIETQGTVEVGGSN